MDISNIIKEAQNDFGILEITNKKEFETLGLANSIIDYDFCTFVDDLKFTKATANNAVMIITTKEITDKIEGKGLCISSSPRITFFKLHNYLVNKDYYRLNKKIKTQIGENCDINDKANIACNNVVIGKNVTIEEFVSIKENVTIGDNSKIRAGTIIGGEGFEFKRLEDSILSVRHIGGVKIGEAVEIQQNVAIDKAIYPWDDTLVGDFTKIDNFVHIAHGVKIGERVLIAAGSCIAGRTVIGNETWIGPKVVISNGLEVGNNCHIIIGSVVLSNLKENIKVFGNPARAYDKNK